MNIKARLESEHSKILTHQIVDYVGSDAKKFKELCSVFLSSDTRLSQRAAWPLSYIASAHPALIKPYFGTFIKKLKDESQHAAIHRNILRVFEEINIPEKYQAELLDECVKFITASHYPAAVRAFAITVATNISKKHVELAKELSLILNELIQYPQQPAIRVRVKRSLQELNAIK
jgi:hypothetical protein